MSLKRDCRAKSQLFRQSKLAFAGLPARSFIHLCRAVTLLKLWLFGEMICLVLEFWSDLSTHSHFLFWIGMHIFDSFV